MLKDKLRKIRGFALVEFIVVMIVIAVLIALALPYYNGMTAKALETKLRNDARVVQDACDYFYGHNGEYPYLLDSEGNKIIAANNNGYFDIVYKVVDFDPTNTDVNFYEIDFNKLRSYLNVDSNPGYFLAAHGNPDFGIVVLNPVSQVTQDRIEKINRGSIADKESFTIVMDYPEDGITTDTIITWSYTYDYDILEEEWEGKQESYPEEGEYTVRLRVKNLNGVWSDWVDISFYVSKNICPPVAVITMTPDQGLTTATNIIWDYSMSIDPQDLEIIEAEWQGKQDNYTDEGEYTVSLRVQNSAGVWSDWNDHTFYVFEEVVQVAAGYGHTLALKGDGTVWAWGDNSYGQLGDGTTEYKITPVRVKGGAKGGTYLTGIKAISAFSHWSIALGIDGSVYTWGHNACGVLGDGLTTDRHTPVRVKGGVQGGSYLVDIASISAGGSYSLALGTNGNVYAWGHNDYGQLGDGLTTNKLTPVKVKGGAQGGSYLVDIASISAGGNHSIAVDNSGNVYAWGHNAWGQLGDNSTTDRHTPVRVKGGSQGGSDLTDIMYISASGAGHSLAVDTDGNVYAWGYNNYGQLGDGSITNKLTPVKVKGGAQGGTNLGGITCISSNEYYSLALGVNGDVYSWGRNNCGQLGDGSVTNRSKPVQVKGGEKGGDYLSGIKFIFSGLEYSTSIGTDGNVYAWGRNSYGPLGDGTRIDSYTPVRTQFLQ